MSNLQKKNAWDRYPGETVLAYKYFLSYLEIGSERSLSKVVQKAGKKVHYKTQLAKWSSKYNWVERVKEYDDYMLSKVLKNKEDVLEKARGRLLKKVNKALDELFLILEGEDNHKVPEGTQSSLNAKLKTIELTLKLAGLNPPSEDVDPGKTVSVQQYIQNIYNMVEGK